MEITPFRIAVPQADLDDLHDRLDRTRWPREIRGAGWERGTPVGYLRDLVAHWRHRYDWRAAEARLNAFPQFTTEIDGQGVHFLHVRSPHEGALPLLVSHGWPSSVVEFERVVAPLVDPADPREAFHLVVPSLPGFGFSPPVTEPGWGLPRTVGAYAELMRRLGYERYGTQGGDIGAGVAGMLAGAAPGSVVGIHLTGPTNMLPPPADLAVLTDRERLRLERAAHFAAHGTGYLQLQADQPSTIGVALHDSPVAQLAWIVEKFQAWTDPARPLPEDAVDLDQLLTTVTATWFTGAGAASAHFIHESMNGPQAWSLEAGAPQAGETPTTPTAVAVFPADHSVRAMVDTGSVVRWTEYDRGGHFPAMEVPELFVGDVRAFFADLR
jgi:epoxide hydrolase